LTSEPLLSVGGSEERSSGRIGVQLCLLVEISGSTASDLDGLKFDNVCPFNIEKTKVTTGTRSSSLFGFVVNETTTKFEEDNRTTALHHSVGRRKGIGNLIDSAVTRCLEDLHSRMDGLMIRNTPREIDLITRVEEKVFLQFDVEETSDLRILIRSGRPVIKVDLLRVTPISTSGRRIGRNRKDGLIGICFGDEERVAIPITQTRAGLTSEEVVFVEVDIIVGDVHLRPEKPAHDFDFAVGHVPHVEVVIEVLELTGGVEPVSDGSRCGIVVSLDALIKPLGFEGREGGPETSTLFVVGNDCTVTEGGPAVLVRWICKEPKFCGLLSSEIIDCTR